MPGVSKCLTRAGSLRDILSDDHLSSEVLPENGPSYVGADLQVARIRYITRGIEVTVGTTKYMFNSQGRLRQIRSEGINIDLEYSSTGRLAVVTDGKRSGEYIYGGSGQVNIVRFNDGSQYEYAYDDKGHLISVSLAGDIVMSYGYDAAGRLVKLTSPRSSGADRSITYFESGLRHQVITPETEFRWEFRDDPNGLPIVTQQIRSGDRTTADRRYEFDYADNRLTMIDDGDTTVYHLTACLCLPLDVERGGKKTVYRYDPFGRLVGRAGSKSEVKLTYDDRVNKLKKREVMTGEGWRTDAQFGYDSAGNLVETTAHEQHLSIGYDKQGHITSITDHVTKREVRMCSVCAPLRAVKKAQSENAVFSIARTRCQGNAMFFVSNLLSYSQAGRRGFESRLPLHWRLEARGDVGCQVFFGNHPLHHIPHRTPDLADRLVTQTAGRQLAQHAAQMLRLQIAATQYSDLRQDGSSKQVLRLLPRGFAPVSVFVLLRNVHLLHKPPHGLGSERVRRVSVQYCNDVVQRDPGLLLVLLGSPSELNPFLRCAWGGIVFPVPDLSIRRFANTASLIPSSGHERVRFPRLRHEFLNLDRLYHAASLPVSFRSRQRAIESLRKTTFRPYWKNGSGSIPEIIPRRIRCTVATLQPSARAVSAGVSQSRVSCGGSGRRERVFLCVMPPRSFGCSNTSASISFPIRSARAGCVVHDMVGANHCSLRIRYMLR
jgi:YD repeat-containing protein